MAVKKLYTGMEENQTYEYSFRTDPGTDGQVGRLNRTEEEKSMQDLYSEDVKKNEALKFLLESAVLCNDAYYINKDTCHLAGDPTETALIELGSSYLMEKNNLESILPREYEEPFDSTRKMMTTVHRITEDYLGYGNTKEKVEKYSSYLKNGKAPRYILFSKGAPEVIAQKCSRMIENEEILDLTDKDKNRIGEINTKLANSAMRNLAFAFKYLSDVPASKDLKELENDMVYSGMVGMLDPPRPEVFDAVKKCKKSNINIIMVTGDHKLTAKAIGEELGILGKNDMIIDEEEFSSFSDEKLKEEIEKIKVFARVSPEHKVNIVDALKEKDHIVAMTGDGINDAPSLKRADIGLAMGITGTDVSKEASDMILTDDNFATIVKAIKQGRVIYDNLKKFILFLLSCNISEVLLMFIAIVLGSFIFRLLGGDATFAYIPLLPVQILWMNLITDGLPAFALGVNPSAPNIMERKATKRRERILSKNRLWQISWQGLMLTLGALFIYFIGPMIFSTYNSANDIDVFHTCVFTTLVLSQLLHAFNFRFDDRGIFRKGIFSSRILNISVVSSILLQIAIIYVPFLQNIFSTAALNIYHWLVIILSSIVPIIIINIINEIIYYRKRGNKELPSL
jgi:Ca2+-transporting ATPase